MSAMRVLVTGGGGFVGSWLVAELSKQYEVVATVRDLHSPRTEQIMPFITHLMYCEFIDYEDVERLIGEYFPPIVFHLASFTIVKEANAVPLQAYSSNTLGTCYLLEACRSVGCVKQFVYLQTDKALGEGMDLDEGASLQASGPYETSKAMAELAIRSYWSRYDLPFTIVRSCNIYGEGDWHPRVITNTIKNLIEKNEATIYNNVNYVRQYIHVSDVVSALKFVAENSDRTIGETYHIAQTQPITQAQVVTSICKKWTELTKKEPTIKYGESTVREVTNESLNCDKIARLGWKPQVLFENGIARTIHYWLNEYGRR